MRFMNLKNSNFKKFLEISAPSISPHQKETNENFEMERRGDH